MSVRALPAGMVPSVWTSLTAMSVTVQRVRVEHAAVARARMWAGGLMDIPKGNILGDGLGAGF